MNKLKVYFLLFFTIISLNSSYLAADVAINNFDLNDVFKSGRNLMALDYGLNYL